MISSSVFPVLTLPAVADVLLTILKSFKSSWVAVLTLGASKEIVTKPKPPSEPKEILSDCDPLI